MEMWRSLFSYFWNKDSEELSLEEAYNVLDKLNEEERNEEKKEDESNIELENQEYSSSHKTGVITYANKNTYVIDNIYQFESDLKNLKVGMKVAFIAYISGNETKISHINVCDSDWDLNIVEDNVPWCTRQLITKVVKREGRKVFVSPGDITIDLNKVSSEFIPIAGDWIDLEVKVEIDEKVPDLFGKILDINIIRPLRPRIVQGKVKKWDNSYGVGVIDNKIFFNKESLLAGFIPNVGERVITEAIESDQGIYTWRSLKVIPQDSLRQPVDVVLNSQPDYEVEVDGIYISDPVYVNIQKTNDSIDFYFLIENKTENVILLLNAYFCNDNRQCTIKTKCFNVEIKSKETLTIECQCVKAVGPVTDLFLFDFQNFKIGRHVTINVHKESFETYDRAKYVHSGSLLLQARMFTNRKSEDAIRGQKPAQTPRFISAKLPEYPVPEKLKNIVLKYNNTEDSHLDEELQLAKPCLKIPLRFSTYEDRFHTLLHLEEIQGLIAIRTYDQETACFIRNGEFMMLEIDNLSERRPSIIIGDRILAKDSYDPDGSTFEGFVHKVGAKHVYLKFAPAFHDNYNGEDYLVRVVSSRTYFRRLHQAVGLVVRNLGPIVLFPSKVVSKPPQVQFSYDNYEDVLITTEKKLKDRTIETKLKYNQEKEKTATLNDSDIQNQKIYKEMTSTDTPNANNMAENNEKKCKSKLILITDQDNRNSRKANYKVSKENNYYTKSRMFDTNGYFPKKQHFKLEWYDKSLNYYQKEAVRNVLLGEARPMPYIIFGPPGTGKTVTLIEIILQILRMIPHSRLLVAAPSNSAADIIALRLIDSGILKPGDLIRLVAYKCVTENSIPPKLVPYSATLDLAREGTRESPPTVTQEGLTIGCNLTTIGRHRITVGTCSALGGLLSLGFSKGHFSHIIVDEAGQASEPDVMIPLAFLDIHTGQAIMAGDHMQLGPVILSKIALAHGLQESYLERLINRFPYVRDTTGFPHTNGYDPRLVTKLLYNYRSLPELLTLPNQLFYNGELKATISDTESEEANLLQRVKEILPQRENKGPPPLVFHGVLGENYQSSDSPSWFNPNEASQIFYYVNELYRLGVSADDIGIITPYIKQVKLIRALLNEAEFEIPKIGTVEEFQGQEYKVILLSIVRSNENLVSNDLKYAIGFLANPRRMNVSLTRAQALTVVVGNPYTLSTDFYWRSLIKYCVENCAYCGCEIKCT